ncbi:helix-turn-helix domain-containing protein [Aliamphritea ceti]|uniref:helix-turn-helix domain-containing protein n=1 Tax=Aliamphritea ceti TaxID=1524258 RepID=UPI0021C3C9CF|nr:AraC family transcriptional regulator [Aliamphritea ceti]
MLFIPVPFVITVVICILLLQKLYTSQGGKKWLSADHGFTALLVLYAVSSVLIGLRWGYDMLSVLPLQSLLASLWGPLAWLSFRRLSQANSQLIAADWQHSIPVFLILCLIAFYPAWIDITLIGIFSFYAVLLFRLMLAGPNSLKAVRFSEAISSYRALQVTAVMMVFFVLVDSAVSIDFRFYEGNSAGLIVALANLPALLLLSFAASLAGNNVGQSDEGIELPCSEAKDVTDDVNLAAIFTQVEFQMQTQLLYQDEQLNLNMLARKCGVPARQISRAINKQTQKNVSQYVNGYRIRAACELLKSTEQSITQVMLAVGYVTKSNFNREFLRLTGANPGQWRQSQQVTKA